MKKLSTLSSSQINKRRRFFNVLFWTMAVLAIICIVGFLFCIIMMGLGSGNLVIYGTVSACFFAGTAVFALCAYPFFGKSDKLAVAELDALEREDDLYSFFVGEGTYVTFRKDELFLHGEPYDEMGVDEYGKYGMMRKRRTLSVPYYDIRFFSICTRRRPVDAGNWSIILQIPARYFNKGAVREARPILLQTDGKERLYLRMRELKLSPEGELPPEALTAGQVTPETPETEKKKPVRKAPKKKAKKFTRLKKFVLADQKRRMKAFILLVIGVLFLAGGIVAAIFWDESVGGVIALVGGYMGVRALVAYVRAKAQFYLYEEGIYYSEPSGVDNVFLKWEEFSTVKTMVRDNKNRMRVQCPYGVYEFPVFAGALEEIFALHPEKEEIVPEETKAEGPEGQPAEKAEKKKTGNTGNKR